MSARAFKGTARFHIVRKLGEGGMGVVFEAFDCEQQTSVALKLLPRRDPRALLRFKQEFRSLQHIQHANLVRLGELFVHGEAWFFTMELVRGVHLDRWVCPTGEGFSRGLDELRLRRALVQLAGGLAALHEAGKVHRDVKPSNVLVTADGRAVLLDFGFVADVGSSEADNLVVGTLHFMSPEQAGAAVTSPKADIYSVGVILYQLLTGRRPFEDATDARARLRRGERPLKPSMIAGGISPYWDSLCFHLLSPDPDERPTAKELIRSLTGAPGRPPSMPPSARPLELFVGRRHELDVLRSLFDRSQQEPVVACVHGEAGIGKSDLLRVFLAQLGSLDCTPLVLFGRCYERESVPFKAFDGLMDELARHLVQLPTFSSRSFDAELEILGRVFPSVQRARDVRKLKGTRDLEAWELRLRLFAAFRRILAELASQRPLVIAIDDLHWAEADSLALLEDVVRGSSDTPILIVYTARTAETVGLLPATVESIRIGALAAEDAHELARRLVASAASRVDPAWLAAEARGHPLFLAQLAGRFVGDLDSHDVPGIANIRLEDVIRSRIERCSSSTVALLELIAIAGRPLPRGLVAEAMGETLSVVERSAAELRALFLARTGGVQPDDLIEPYHDRIREVVVAGLSSGTRSSWHRRLARILERRDRVEGIEALRHPAIGRESIAAEALMVHWREAGERRRAALYAEIGARQAASALAFQRASELYRAALDLGDVQGSSAVRLLVALAEALASGGRCTEAADTYLEAARSTVDTVKCTELQEIAAHHYLRSGHIERAIALFRAIRKTIGIAPPRTAARTVAAFLAGRSRVRLGRLRSSERAASLVPAEDLRRIDTCFSMALAMSAVHTFLGAELQTRQLLLARRAGEPYRLARALALEAAYHAASTGARGVRRTDRIAAHAMEIARRIDHPHALGLVAWSTGTSAYLMGNWAQGHEQAERALEIYIARCTGVHWEVASAQAVALWSLHYLGRINEMRQRVPWLLERARARGDRYDATNLRTSHANVVWLAADQPDLARAEVHAAMREWLPQSFQLPHYYEIYSLTQNDLYTGQGLAAYQRVTEGWRKMRRAFLFWIHAVHMEMSFLRARSALAAAASVHPTERNRLLSEAEADARTLGRAREPWACALAALVRGLVAVGRRETQIAVMQLEGAARGFERASMPLHAAIARRRLAETRTDSASLGATNGQIVGCGVENPDRFAALIAPLPVPP